VWRQRPNYRSGVNRTPSCFALIAALIAAQPALAQTSEFYRGKTITLLIGGTAGGGIDLSARILAPYLAKHLPGHPTVTPQVMPGAGGIRMAAYMNASAARDGTVIGTTGTGPLLEPLIGARNAALRMTDFVSIGAMTKDISLCVSWHGSAFKTIDDARARQMTVAGTGAGATPDIYPVVLNELLGTRFKVITGYQGTQETILAIERTEVDGRCGWGFASLKTTKPDWVRDRKLNYLVQLGLTKSTDFPDVPLAIDLVQNAAGKDMLTLLFTPLDLNRPFLAPPGIPGERAAELRNAFMRAMKDPGLREEMRKLAGEDVNPTAGEEMQTLLARIYATPAGTVEKLRNILAR
jgi:tripartite-type tricarboxylate transporter receptor subunit TctC